MDTNRTSWFKEDDEIHHHREDDVPKQQKKKYQSFESYLTGFVPRSSSEPPLEISEALGPQTLQTETISADKPAGIYRHHTARLMKRSPGCVWSK